MILQCPSCFAKYFIEDKLLNSSQCREVKCMKCCYQWIHNATEVGIDKVNISKIDAAVKANSYRNLNYSMVLNTVIVLLVVLCFALFFHNEFPLQLRCKIYNSLPFKVAHITDTQGIIFDGLEVENSNYKMQHNIAIKGFIVNNTNKIKIVPPIRICLDDHEQKCIKNYYIKSSGKVIAPKEREYFSYRIVDVSSGIDKAVIDMGNKIELMLR
ncbi:hypothetical protein CAXC1_330098 [Candidatus Xenohaliotis californiensis]|uniref:Zinc finger/thioredoxin putative domain-containing protein n=1 Tax=Candidatus Xenohaliotis californiensis TaxID=84677 RepID=A0ABM9N8T3_9RICK|nr:hypothetical protein CAXC1_330098 [Candidatus Xenohaliotis californiensis]